MKSKKGILGLDTVKGVIIALLTLAVITIAAYLALTSLQGANLFTGTSAASTAAANSTVGIIGNITGGGNNFWTQVPTFFTILAVVVLILIISIVIVAVTRFGGGAGSSLGNY